MVFSITAFIAKVVVIFALLLHVSFNVSAMNVVETNRAARIASKFSAFNYHSTRKLVNKHIVYIIRMIYNLLFVVF